jgi:hypothetical protein
MGEAGITGDNDFRMRGPAATLFEEDFIEVNASGIGEGTE